MTFGELNTTNTKLQGKRVIIDNYKKGTYYVPVVAKDQYGNSLTADQLNAKYDGNLLFINPTAAQGAYGGFDTNEKFTTLDDGTVAMNVGGAAPLPGEAVITVAGLGGLSTSTKYTVEDNPYIASMETVFPGSIYAETAAEFTVSATDQYGDAVSIYDCELNVSADKKTISFGDANSLTKNGSSIAVNNGTLSFARNSSDKSVKFTYTPNSGAKNDVATVTTAVPKVTTTTLTIGKVGTPASIQKTLDTTKKNSALSVTSGTNIDFASAIVFVDTNGEKVTGKPVAKPTITSAKILTGASEKNDGTNGTLDAAADTYYWQLGVKDTTNYSASGIVNPTKNTTYVASLYYVEKADGPAKLLDTQEFKAYVTTPSNTGNKYEEYEAIVKSGDELLANWSTSNDNAEIIVKGTDANNVTAILSEGTDYKLTVDSDLQLAGSVAQPASGSIVQGDNETAKEGTATVSVWDAQSGQKVTSVKLAYSNAKPVATKWSVNKQDDDNTAYDKGISQNADGVENSAYTLDTIDVPSGAGYSVDSDQGAIRIVDTGNLGGTVFTSYLVECKDQYGLRYKNVAWSLGGTALSTNSDQWINDTSKSEKKTFLGTAKGLEDKNLYVVVAPAPAE
jgi:hypothetical protein